MSRCARLAREACQAPLSRGSPVSFQARGGDPRWTWLAWRPRWPKMAWRAWSPLGSHGTRLTLCTWSAIAAGGTWFATVTLRSR